MDPSPKQQTSGSQPYVRSACEPCHERKVRCIVSTDGGQCKNCKSKKQLCFFLPRHRSGRPPVQSPSQGANVSAAPFNNHYGDDSHILSARVETAKHNPLEETTTSTQNDYLGWNWTSPTGHFPERSHSVMLSSLDMTPSDAPMGNDFSLQGSVLGGDYPNLANGDTQPMQLGEPSTFPGLEMSVSPEPTASLPLSDHIGTTDKHMGEKVFAMLLRCCTRLQNHVTRSADVILCSPSGESIRTPVSPSTVSIIQLQDMLGDLDASCNFIFGIYGQGILSKPAAQLRGDLDHASASLTNALILKIFQICHAVFSCNLLTKHGLDDMLLHKRLDFNITQARIVMTRIQKLTQDGLLLSRNIAMNASHLEEKFKSIS